MKYILDINWNIPSKSEPYPEIVLQDNGDRVKYALPGFMFDWKLSRDKYCIGYWEDSVYITCNRLIDNKYERCHDCDNNHGFRSAFLFGQNPNKNATKYLSQKHFIYLAYFEHDRIKVGTTSYSRRVKRLIEQDALVYTFLAQSDGFHIQDLERTISNTFDIPERVTSKQKFSKLSYRPDLDHAVDLVQHKLRNIIGDPMIKSEFGSWLLSDNIGADSNPSIHNFLDNNFLYFPKDPHLPQMSDYLAGKFLGLRGRYLIVKNGRNEVCLDKKTLLGRRIEESGTSYTYKIEQDSQINFL